MMIGIFDTWKRGALVILMLLMFGVLAPTVLIGLLVALIVVPMSLIGFDLEFLDRYANDIIYTTIIIYGPYLIGKKWEDISEILSQSKTN